MPAKAALYPSSPSAPAGAYKRLGGAIGGPERWASAAGGALLIALGLRRGGLSGLVAGGAGVALIGRGATGHCPAKAALNASPAERRAAEQQGWAGASVTGSAQTINRPRAEVYAWFRDLNNFARVMENVAEVRVLDDRRSHWVVKAPAGRTVAWDSTIVEDEADRLIAWRADEGADIKNAGKIAFRDAPGGRGTEVHVTISFQPPLGMVGRTLAALFLKDPSIELRQDLKRAKSMLETGEVATTKAPDAAPRGAGPFGLRAPAAKAA